MKYVGCYGTILPTGSWQDKRARNPEKGTLRVAEVVAGAEGCG